MAKYVYRAATDRFHATSTNGWWKRDGSTGGTLPVDPVEVQRLAYGAEVAGAVPFRQIRGDLVVLRVGGLNGPNGTQSSVSIAGTRGKVGGGAASYGLVAGEVLHRLHAGRNNITVTVTDSAGGTAQYEQVVFATGRSVDPFWDNKLTGDGEWLYRKFTPGATRSLQFCVTLPTVECAQVEIVQVSGTKVQLSQTKFTYVDVSAGKVYPSVTVTYPADVPNMDLAGFRAKVTFPYRPTWNAAWGSCYYIQLVKDHASAASQTIPDVFPANHWSHHEARRIPVASAADGVSGADSSAFVTELFRQGNGIIGMNVNSFAGALYMVDASTPVVDVRFNDYYNSGIETPKPGFAGVPVPPNCTPSLGTDGHIAFYRADTDQWWEFWQWHLESDGTYWAASGGRVDNFSQGQGQNKTGSLPSDFTVSASGLALMPTLLKVREIQAALAAYDPQNEAAWDNHINHVLNVALPGARSGKVCWPGTNTDGLSSATSAPWQAQRLWIDASLDLKTLGLTKGEHIMARAMQKYGGVTSETAGSVTISTQSGYAWELVTGTNPYTEMFGGSGKQWDMFSKIPQSAWRFGRIFLNKAAYDAALLP